MYRDVVSYTATTVSEPLNNYLLPHIYPHEFCDVCVLKELTQIFYCVG